MKKLRVAIVVSHPIQHFCPMYREIAADERVELLVIFAEAGAAPRFDSGFGKVVQWQSDLLDGFASTVLQVEESQRSAAVVDALKSYKPDAVYVHGYALDYLRSAARWANQNRVAVLMTTDSELLHPRPWYVRLIKQVALRYTLRSIDLFLTVGDENERYFRAYGVPDSRFHRVSFSIDSRYYDQVLADRESVRHAVRNTLGIPEKGVTFLTVGKMIPRKEHARLIQAFAVAQKKANYPAVLLIAGDGPLRAELEALAAPVKEHVRLLGFVGVEELPSYYIAADVYVHPSSHDPHPLAISEALYCGLPVIASSRIGSVGATDDVQLGINGWSYPYEDTNALAETMTRVIDDADLRAKAGAASRPLGLHHAASYCAEQFVDGVVRCVEMLRATPR